MTAIMQSHEPAMVGPKTPLKGRRMTPPNLTISPTSVVANVKLLSPSQQIMSASEVPLVRGESNWEHRKKGIQRRKSLPVLKKTQDPSVAKTKSSRRVKKVRRWSHDESADLPPLESAGPLNSSRWESEPTNNAVNNPQSPSQSQRRFPKNTFRGPTKPASSGCPRLPVRQNSNNKDGGREPSPFRNRVRRQGSIESMTSNVSVQTI